MNGIKRTDFKTGRELKPGERPTRVSFGLRPKFGRRAPLTAEQPAPESPYPAMAIPQTWGEGVGYNQPISLPLEAGGTVEALVRPDRTVWRGDEQIGSIDERGTFTPAPPSVWEQFGEAAKTIGLKTIEYAFKPLEMFQEYVATPFAMGVTAPGWREQWWENKTRAEQRELIARGYRPGELAAESPVEFLKEFFGKEGEFREAYHEWEGPKYLRGALELLPWFFLPGAGQAAGAVGKLGKAGQLAAKALTPAIAVEKAIGKVIQVPITQAGRVIKRITLTKGLTLAAPKPAEALLAETRTLHPNLLGVPRGLGLTTKQIEKARIERQWKETNAAADVIRSNDNLLANNEVQRLSGTINRLGKAEEVFLLKKMPVAGRPKLPPHTQVTAPWVQPKQRGASMYLRDILEAPESYIFDRSAKGQIAKHWIEQYREGVSAIDKLASENISKEMRRWVDGVPPEGMRSPSRVVAEFEPSTGKQLWRQDPFAGGTRGGTIAAMKRRKFRSQKEGVELGFEYVDDPVASLALYAKGAYNMASYERQMAILKIPYETTAERLATMGGDIANRMKEIDRSIKFLGGGLTRATTKEGKVIIEKHPGLKALIQNVRRGEVPSAATIGAIERRFPELGAGLRDALEISYLEFDQAIKGISEAIFKDTKVTRDKFRETLSTIRAKRVTKPSAGVTRQADEVMRAKEELAGLEESLATDPVATARFEIGKRVVGKGLKGRVVETKADLTHFISIKEQTFPEYFTLKEARALFPRHGFVNLVKGKVPRDAALDDLIKKFGMSADEIAERVMQIRAEKARIAQLKAQVATGRPLEKELRAAGAGRNVGAGELSETLDALGVEAGKQVRFLRELYQSAYKETNVEREAALKQLLNQVKGEITKLNVERSEGLPAFRRARQDALEAAAAEGRVVSLPGWMGRIIPDRTEYGLTGRQIADELMKRFSPERVNPIVQKASTLARVGVTLIAALDSSLLFIQGPLALGHDIVQWASFRKSSAFFNMTKGLIKGISRLNYQDELLAKEAALLQRYAPEGLVVSKAVDYLQPEIIEMFLRKGGTIGGWAGAAFRQSYGRFGAGFGSGSLAGRIAIIKHAERAWLDAGLTPRQLAEFANKVTGVISSEALGVKATQRVLESAMLFSPNYTRAYIMVFRDLFRRGLPANEVRKAMAGMLAGGFLSYVGLCEMLGQEPKLNPAPKALGGDGAEFMSFKIENSVVGLPGFWYSAIRTMVTVAAVAEQEPEKLLSIDWRENPALYFWMSRTSPLVHLGSEIIEQRDFLGRNLDAPGDWMETLGSHFMTIAAQNLITRRPEDEEGKYHRVGAEIFGLRAFPQSDWIKLDDMKNEYAQREFKKPFDDLNREQRDKLLATYPEYKALADEAGENIIYESGEDWQSWLLDAEKQADAEYHAIGEHLARSLFAGQLDYRTYLDEESTLRKIYQGKAKVINEIESQADPEQAKRWKKWREEGPPEDRALDKYWEIRSDLKRTPAGQIDWDENERRVKAYLAPLDSDTRSYILRMKDRGLVNLPPMMQKIAQVQAEGREVVDEYYDQPQGVARVTYRRQNPTVDAWLLIMGRVSVPRTEAAMQLVMEMLRQRGLPQTLIAALAEGVMPSAATPVTTADRFARRPLRVRWK